MTFSVKHAISELEAVAVDLHRAKEMAARFGAEDDVHRALVRVGSLRNQCEKDLTELPARRISKSGMVLQETPAATLFPDTPADREKRVDRLIEHFRHAEAWWSMSQDRKSVV